MIIEEVVLEATQIYNGTENVFSRGRQEIKQFMISEGEKRQRNG